MNLSKFVTSSSSSLFSSMWIISNTSLSEETDPPFTRSLCLPLQLLQDFLLLWKTLEIRWKSDMSSSSSEETSPILVLAFWSLRPTFLECEQDCFKEDLLGRFLSISIGSFLVVEFLFSSVIGLLFCLFSTPIWITTLCFSALATSCWSCGVRMVSNDKICECRTVQYRIYVDTTEYIMLELWLWSTSNWEMEWHDVLLVMLELYYIKHNS